MAMFFEFYEQWVATEATIARMHFIMESVESVVKKDPAAAVAKCVLVFQVVCAYCYISVGLSLQVQEGHVEATACPRVHRRRRVVHTPVDSALLV